MSNLLTKSSVFKSVVINAMAIALLGLAACSNTTSQPSENPSIGNSNSETDVDAAVAPQGRLLELNTLIRRSARLYEAAENQKWPIAANQIKAIKESIGTLKANNKLDDAEIAQLEAQVNQLEQAVNSKDGAATMQQSMTLLKAATEQIKIILASVQPVEIVVLNSYAHMLEADATAQNVTTAKETATNIKSTWEALRPRIEAKGGTAATQPFDNLVAELEKAQSAQDYSQLAPQVLTGVEGLQTILRQ